MRKTYLEVDRKAFLNNCEAVKKKVNNKVLMPVIKANAYGTYINKDIELISQFDIVAVEKIIGEHI